MARDLSPDIERLLENSNPYIRKKAALCAIRVLKKNPELVEEYIDRAASLLHDKNHGVALSGVTLMLAITGLEPGAVERYRAHVPVLCKMLRGLLQGGFNPEYDVGGICDPYLQVKILQLLRVLGRGNADASDAMTDILAQVAASVEGGRNAGWAILYEAVATIMGIETIGGLRVMAVNILGRFLANRDNNIRYVALNTLAQVVAVDTQAVQRHRATIVDCVKDADVSIRRRALELVYSLVNEGNIRNLTRELLDYLAVCDSEFKPDLTAKIAALITRFAPDRRWHFDNLLCVLVQAGGYVKESVVHHLIALVSNAEELQPYAVRRLYAALLEALDSPSKGEPALLYAAAWAVGEYGEMLPAGRGGPLLPDEPPLSVSESGVVDALEALVNRRPRLTPATLEVALTAAAKLTARLPSQTARLSGLVSRYKGSVLLEVQSRCCEYSKLLDSHAGITPQLLERMPAIEDPSLSSGNATPVASSGGAAAAALLGDTAAAAAPAAAGDDLVDLLGGLDAAAAAVGRVSSSGVTPPSSLAGGAAAGGGALGGLDDLLGLGPAAAPGADLMGMLGGSTPAAVADPLSDLLGGGAAAAAPAAPPAAAAAAGPSSSQMVVFDQDGLRLTFDVQPVPGVPGTTAIQARAVNSGLDDLTDFNLQAAVPKYLQLKLEPASGSVLTGLGGSVSQSLTVVNSMQGSKGLVMRLRVNYSKGGQPVLQQLEVANFPPGL